MARSQWSDQLLAQVYLLVILISFIPPCSVQEVSPALLVLSTEWGKGFQNEDLMVYLVTLTATLAVSNDASSEELSNLPEVAS